MKFLLPVLSLVALSGVAVAQDAPTPAPVKPPIPTTPIFRDVPPTHWAFAAVQRLASAGIIEGYGTTPATRVVAEVVPAKPAPKAAVKIASAPPIKTQAKPTKAQAKIPVPVKVAAKAQVEKTN